MPHSLSPISRLLFLLPVLLALMALPDRAQALSSVQQLQVSTQVARSGFTSLTVHPSIVADPADGPFATTQADIFLDRDLKLNAGRFASCREGVVQSDETRCPKGSRVGSGSAQGLALGMVEELKVQAFNGPRGRSVLLLVTGSVPLQIRSVLVASIKPAATPYGHKLSIPVPENLQQPAPGVLATLTDFQVTVSARRGRLPYLKAAGCSRLDRFAGTFSFTDMSVQSPLAQSTCRRR